MLTLWTSTVDGSELAQRGYELEAAIDSYFLLHRYADNAGKPYLAFGYET